MRSPRRMVLALLIITLSLIPGVQAADTDSLLHSVPQAEESVDDAALRKGIAVTGGCVGGAVIGTVVPVFGNFVGCIVGGLAGWWFGHDDGENESASAPQAAL